MRILIANEALSGHGGVETYLAALISALQHAGHDVGVLHQNTAKVEHEPHAIASHDTWRVGVEDVGLDEAIRRVRSFAPDVCFSHNMRSLEIESQLLAGWPVVKMMHGHFGTCISGHKMLAFPSSVACTRDFGTGCFTHYWTRRCGQANPVRVMRAYEWSKSQRGLLPEYHSLVVASRYMRDQYLRTGVTHAHVHAIPLFAPRVAEPAEHNGHRSIDVIFVGRLTNLKGPDVVIDAVARAMPRVGRPMNVVFAGDGPERDYVREYATTRGVNARFTGWITAAERDTLLSDSTMLAVPSRWPEPFGLVGLEAAARGTPAVAFNTGGIRDWLTDDENGRLVAPSDDKGFADAIADIATKPALHARLSAGAREAASRFTVEAYLRALVPVLTSAAGRSVEAS